jgi:hypothetical protein
MFMLRIRFDTFCTVPVIASSAPMRRAKRISQPPQACRLLACASFAIGVISTSKVIIWDDVSEFESYHRLAGFGGTFSQSVYGSCLNVEQSAALALQNRWSSIPASVRERCDRIARFGGWAPRGRRHCEVLFGDAGGRPGNPV